jgi:hypothetical protein
MRPQVEQYISRLTDEELAEYVQSGTTKYDAEAVEFARRVLVGRGVPSDRLAALTASAGQRLIEQDADQMAVAQRPLNRSSRWLAFIAGFFSGIGVIPLLIAWGHFYASRQRQKGQDMWRSAFFGFICFWVVGLICFFLSVLLR